MINRIFLCSYEGVQVPHSVLLLSWKCAGMLAFVQGGEEASRKERGTTGKEKVGFEAC